MVHCAQCTVNPIDRHCTNHPRTCYECCTTSATTPTCPPHFKQLGRLAAEARLQTGLVHPNILADAADPEAAEADSHHAPSSPPRTPPRTPVPGGPPPAPPAAGSLPPPQRSAPSPSTGSPPPPLNASASGSAPPDAAASQPVTLESLAATVASMAAFMQQLAQAQAASASAPAAAAVGPTPPAVPAAPLAILPHIPLSPSAAPMPPLVRPPPHRAAVLDRAAPASQSDIAALVNRFSALRDDGDSDEDEAQVPAQSHTRTTRAPPPATAASTAAAALPSAFVPQAVGTEQTAAQQLAAIFRALDKQGGKAKYTTIEELNEALDDWFADAVRANRPLHEVDSIRAYQRVLITRFAISDRMPLKQVLEYHRLWCKAVHAGTLDMFVPGAAMNHDIYYEVTHPLKLLGQAPSAPSSKDGKFKSASSKTTAPSPTSRAKHPAGSCTHHPTSTSHTTAECVKKGKQ